MSRLCLRAAAFGLALWCALAWRAGVADSLVDPTQPQPLSLKTPAPAGGLRVEGILCHAGALSAIVDDRLVHEGDRLGPWMVRRIMPDGVRYSRGARRGFVDAPAPSLQDCAPIQGAAVGPGGASFSVDVANAPADVFFAALVAGTSYNILVHPGVTGPITMSLKNVSLVQVLDALRELYGYDYRHTAAGYLVVPAAIQTRIFHISYLDIERYGVSNTNISSGQVTQGDYNSQYGNATTMPTTQTMSAVVGSKNDRTTIDTSGNSIVTRENSDFWGNLTADLRAMVGSGPGRRVIVDPQSGMIVVSAMPGQLREVGEYLRRTEQTVTRQVVLEAKVVEVDLGHAYQAGIDWAQVLQLGSSHYFIGQSSPPGGFGANELTPTNTPVTVGPGNPVSSLTTNTLGGAFTLAADFTNFNTFIQLLSTEGHTHVLSSPRVSTLDNQQAIIKAGTDQFYVTGVQSNTVTGTATSTSNNVILTPFFSGVALDVTPQIAADGEVLLHIHPIVSTVTNQTVTLQVQGSPDVLPLAQSAVRESDSIVRARSGQVIVIGGLMQETVDRQQYKTPLLGDLPGVGRLFRSEQDQKSKIELVILLRALVVGGSDWAQVPGEPAAGAKDMP